MELLFIRNVKHRFFLMCTLYVFYTYSHSLIDRTYALALLFRKKTKNNS